jgi:hypothetical protein
LVHTPEEYKLAHIESLQVAADQQARVHARAIASLGSNVSLSSGSSSTSSSNSVEALPPVQVVRFGDDEFYQFDSTYCLVMVRNSRCVGVCDLRHGISNSASEKGCRSYDLATPCSRLWSEEGCPFNHGMP